MRSRKGKFRKIQYMTLRLGFIRGMFAAGTLVMLVGHTAMAQKAVAQKDAAHKDADKGSAYYHYGLAHMYEDMAVNGGRPDYATQAVEEYKLALDADPNSTYLQDGLAELYMKVGRIREAVAVAQEQVKKNPNDMDAHELLGKIYLRSLGDMQSGQSGQMLQLAIGEYEKLTQLKPQSVENRLVLGQLYALNHDSVKAEAQFRLAQKVDPNSEETVLNMARLYSEQGDLQRTEKTLSAMPVADRTARIEFALGGTYDQLKRPKDAAAAYRRALEIDSDNVDAKRGLANALLVDGQLKAALDQYTEIVAAEPQDAESYVHIADIQRRQGNYKLALETLQKAKALVPDSQSLSYNEALTYDALGRYDEALRVLAKLLTDSAHTDGNYSEGEKSNRALFLDRVGIVNRELNKVTAAVEAYKAMSDLGGEYVARGYQGAVDTYREAHDTKAALAMAAAGAKAYPKEVDVQVLYAKQLVDGGRVDEGLALARAQLGGKGGDRDIRLELANMYMRLKRWKEASDELDKAEALMTKPEEKVYAYFLRGTMDDRQKMFDQAEAQFRKVLAADPMNAGAMNYLGYMLADRGVRLTEARELVQKAVDLDPQNGAYLDSLGWVYYKLGQYALAEQNVRRAIERSPTDPTVHDHLGEIYEKSGKLKLAVAQWERAMAEYARSLPADADPDDVAKVQRKLDTAKVKLARVGNGATAKRE